MATKAATDTARGGRPLPDERLQELLHQLKLARYFDERMEALYRQGSEEDAHEWTRVAERHTGRADLHAQVPWRCVRAKVLAPSDPDAAEAEAAVVA